MKNKVSVKLEIPLRPPIVGLAESPTEETSEGAFVLIFLANFP